MRASYRDKVYRKYVETYSAVYRKKPHMEEFFRRCKHYELNYKAMLPHNKNSIILELGSGPGYFLKYLHNNGYKNVFGVDTSPQQVNVALELGMNNVSNSDFFDFLTNSNESYDLICSFHVIEHLFKDEIIELLELINDRLDKNGMILIEVPNAGSPIFGGANRYSEFTHEVGFVPSSLKEILTVSGFSDVRVLPTVVPSPYARCFFRAVNLLLHSRFSPDLLIDGEIIGVGYKKG